MGYFDLVNHLGGDADALLAEFDLDRATTRNPDAVLPLSTVAGLIEEGRHQTGCDDFALRLAARQDLMVLGQLAVMALSCPTVGRALDKILEYIHYYNTSLQIDLEREFEPGSARIGLTLKGEFTNPRYAYELALGTVNNCVRALYGENFRPREVQMQFDSPLSQQCYWRFFKAPVRLEQEHNALILSSSQLEKPVDPFSPQLREQIARRIDDVDGASSETLSAGVERIIRRELANQRCTPKSIARELGMDLPGFEARLAAEGVDFDAVLDRIRLHRADRYLETEDIPISEVALRLGFRNKEELAAACRRWFGVSPLERRDRLQRGH